MVEIFKTSIESREQSEIMKQDLLNLFPGAKINFDLDDCDRILRIEDDKICPQEVLNFLAHKGFEVEILI